jgi:hypothetical protein
LILIDRDTPITDQIDFLSAELAPRRSENAGPDRQP